MFPSRTPRRDPFRYDRVERAWPGETVVCMASGPSLTPEDVESVRGRARVIVVNSTYRMAPWADALYAADLQWWMWNKGAPDFGGTKVSVSTLTRKRYPDVKVLRKGDRYGLSLAPDALALGRNSGYQAINLAVLFGASRIVLLGYDMSRGPKGERHWHPDHPVPTPNLYAEFLHYYPSLANALRAEGIEVVNASRRTALDCFPIATLDEALGKEVACL